MKKIQIALIGFLSLLLFACNSFTNKGGAEQNTKQNAVEKSPKVQKSAPLAWTENANIYEVNIRQYTQDGTLNAFAKQLPRLKEMGVDILWLMPIYPIGEKNRKGSLGSYYSVQDYTAVGKEYGSLDDLKNLVHQAHQLHMHVILDWVANHTSWDHAWLTEHPDFYEKDDQGQYISPFDWTDVVSLDYNNQKMREAMRDAMVFWLKEADVDGFRCDVAGEVPTDFWNWLRPQLDEIKPVFMLAEAEKPELLEKAFDMDYGWDFHHLMNQIAKGEKNAKDVWTYLAKEKESIPDHAYRMYFTTNHDENSWNGTTKERLGAATDAMALLTFTLADMPLIYSGQEAANAKRLAFFEKDTIEWNDYPKQGFYKKLTAFKHENAAFWNGLNGGEMIMLPTNQDDKVMAFKRIKADNDMMVLINLSDQTYEAKFTKDNLLNYKPLLMHDFAPTMEINSFTMRPWGYIVLRKVMPKR
jgi:glycosidase